MEDSVNDIVLSNMIAAGEDNAGALEPTSDTSGDSSQLHKHIRKPYDRLETQ